MEQKEYFFHVNGMHCASCVVMIEDALKDVPGITRVMANLSRREVVISGSLGDDAEGVAHDLSERIAPYGYTLAVEKKKTGVDWSEFLYAIPIAAALVLGFIVLQKSGPVDLIDASTIGYGTAFLIGIIASLSTCLAVVGGLVLSVSANYAKGGDTWRPQMLFHVSRIVSFFILGGVIGAIGTVFRFGPSGNLVLGLVVGIIMFLLGLNLLDVFHAPKKFQVVMPKFFGHMAANRAKSSHIFAPLLLGALTFFLPCGFTQSMQIYTLTAGSFMRGGLIMCAFALGTLPILAVLSFGSLKITSERARRIFFKTSGIIVMLLALWGMSGALAAAGLINPIITF